VTVWLAPVSLEEGRSQAMAVRLMFKGPALYGFDRVGRNNVTFKMPKFRSMRAT